jgi:chromosome segregation ATPase
MNGTFIQERLENASLKARQERDESKRELDKCASASHEIETNLQSAVSRLAELWEAPLQTNIGFPQISTELKRLKSAREAKQKTLEANASQCKETISQIKDNILTDAHTEKTLQDQIGELQKTCEATSQASAEYQTLLSQISLAEDATRKANDEWTTTFRTAETQLKSFHQNRLFKALLEAGYGTDDYAPKFLQKVVDDLAAKIINFPENFQRYQTWKMEEHFAATNLDTAKKTQEKLQTDAQNFLKNAFSALGGNQLLENLEKTQKSKEKNQEALEKEQETFSQIKSSLRDIETLSDPDSLEIKKRIKAFIDTTEEAHLTAFAQTTPDQSDDRLCDEIAALRKQLKTATQQTQEASENYKNLDQRAERAKTALLQFQSENRGSKQFDTSEHEVDTKINDLLAFAITSQTLNSWISDQQEIPPPSPTWTPTTTWDSSPSISTGGFDTPSFSIDTGGDISSSISTGGDF